MALKKYFLRFPPYADRKGLLTIPSLALTEYAAFIVHGEMYHHDPFFWMISREHVMIEPEGEAAYPFLVDEPIVSLVFKDGLTNGGFRAKEVPLDSEYYSETIIEKAKLSLFAYDIMLTLYVNGKPWHRKTCDNWRNWHIHEHKVDELRVGPYK